MQNKNTDAKRAVIKRLVQIARLSINLIILAFVGMVLAMPFISEVLTKYIMYFCSVFTFFAMYTIAKNLRS